MILYDQYQKLGHAVVEQAADDYRWALKTIRKEKENTNKWLRATKLIKDCERFFEEHIALYVDVDGLYIRDRIRTEMLY